MPRMGKEDSRAYPSIWKNLFARYTLQITARTCTSKPVSSALAQRRLNRYGGRNYSYHTAQPTCESSSRHASRFSPEVLHEHELKNGCTLLVTAATKPMRSFP
eukprot:9285380-Pyramimonas_sp.AAC.1